MPRIKMIASADQRFGSPGHSGTRYMKKKKGTSSSIPGKKTRKRKYGV